MSMNIEDKMNIKSQIYSRDSRDSRKNPKIKGSINDRRNRKISIKEEVEKERNKAIKTKLLNKNRKEKMLY